MIKGLLTAALAGSLAIFSAAAAADVQASSQPDARVWLDRMAHSFKEQNYRGTLIYGDNRHWETLSITHAVMNGVEYERLIHLNDDPREVIRKGHDITCIHPGEDALRLLTDEERQAHASVHATAHAGGLENPISQSFPQDSKTIDQYYRLSLGESRRIAGRLTQQVNIQSQDDYRYSYRLWLDQQTALLLRSDLIDQQGKVLERFQFADIEIGVALADAAFDAQSEGHHLAAHLVDHADEVKAIQASPWQVQWLPRGFRSVASKLYDGKAENRAQPNQRQAVAKLMYSDGLSAITVFVDRQSDVQSEKMPSTLSQQWGVTAAVVRQLERNDKAYQITVIGEVPLMTLEKIAASVAREG